MNIIFLDIDGVMNTEKHLAMSQLHNGMEFDPESVRNLKSVIKQTGAYLVITSSWRLGETISSLRQKTFDHYDLGQYIVGVTPFLDKDRGREIFQYIKNNQKDPLLKVDQFVIVDDDNDMAPLMDYLVQTDFRTGITANIKDQMIKKLRG